MLKKFNEWLKLKEMGGATDAIVGSCKPTADFQPQGSCSNLKKKKKQKKKQKIK